MRLSIPSAALAAMIAVVCPGRVSKGSRPQHFGVFRPQKSAPPNRRPRPRLGLPSLKRDKHCTSLPSMPIVTSRTNAPRSDTPKTPSFSTGLLLAPWTMPLQPRSFLSLPNTRAFWTCASCYARATPAPLHVTASRRRIARPQTSYFHTSPHRYADVAAPTHYEVLELSKHALPAHINRQYYTLSIEHHPDHNPSDPRASTRFVAISEAYHVLTVPEKRAAYDAQLSHSYSSFRSHSRGENSQHSGSHFGSRSASGLNKKRSTFRGPPPSFYKTGGYGRHGAKRAEYAQYQHAGDTAEQSAGSDSYGGFGEGFGPGQGGLGNEVPHFDDARHQRTHEGVYEHISARRRRKRNEEIPREFDRGGMLVNFLMVSSVVAIAAAATKMFSNRTEGSKKADA